MPTLTTIIIGDEYVPKKMIEDNYIASIKQHYTIDSKTNIHYSSIKDIKLILSNLDIVENQILCIIWIRSGATKFLDVILPAQRYLNKFLKNNNNLLLFTEALEPFNYIPVLQRFFKKENLKQIKYLTCNIDITNEDNDIEIIKFDSFIPYNFPILELLSNKPINITTDFFIPTKTIRATKYTVTSMLKYAGLLESNEYTYTQPTPEDLDVNANKILLEKFKDSPEITLLQQSLTTTIEPNSIYIPKANKEVLGNRYGYIHINQELLDLHKTCMIGIVVEDFFYIWNKRLQKHDQFNLITEKIYNFIYCKKPFMMFQCKDFFKHFKEMGYKSFSPFINEDYDLIQDDITRFKAVIEEMKRITNLSQEEKLILQNNLIEVCEYNFNIMSEKYYNNNLLL